MKANELRIGNYININEPITKEDKLIRVSSYHIGKLQKMKDAYEPIPLTEYYLKKFGFSFMTDTTPYNYRIHKNKSFCYIRYGTFGTFENGVEKSFQGFNGLFIANKFVRVIKYVHELQNLYFGLTGEELNLHVGIQGKNDE